MCKLGEAIEELNYLYTLDPHLLGLVLAPTMANCGEEKNICCFRADEVVLNPRTELSLKNERVESIMYRD